MILPHFLEAEAEAQRNDVTCPRKLGRGSIRIQTPVKVSVPLLSARPTGHTLTNSYSSFKTQLKHCLCSEVFPSASLFPHPMHLVLPCPCPQPRVHLLLGTKGITVQSGTHTPAPSSLGWVSKGQALALVATFPGPLRSMNICFAASVFLCW